MATAMAKAMPTAIGSGNEADAGTFTVNVYVFVIIFVSSPRQRPPTDGLHEADQAAPSTPSLPTLRESAWLAVICLQSISTFRRLSSPAAREHRALEREVWLNECSACPRRSQRR
jgi:hypothetical protein